MCRLMSVTRAHTSLSEQAAKAEQDIKTFKPVAAISDHMEAIHQASLKNDDSLARILFHQESEDAINRQINVEYTNCYLYHSMSAYFARDTVGSHQLLPVPLYVSVHCAQYCRFAPSATCTSLCQPALRATTSTATCQPT